MKNGLDNICPKAVLLLAAIPLLTGLAGCNRGSSQAAATPFFTDVTVQAGIEFAHFNGMSGEFFYPEIMGAGVCFVDYNGDGFLDLYFVNGAALPGVDPSPPPSNRMFRNNRDGTFTDVTGPTGLGDIAYGQGCCAADPDGDGDQDLYVTNWGRNSFYLNNGDGTFREASQRAGIADEGWGQCCAFVDADQDGDLDLYVENYLTYDTAGNLECKDETVKGARRDYCAPQWYEGQSDILYVNNGDGTFSDRTRDSGMYEPSGKGMGMVWFDVEGDGDPDLYVANDGMRNFLFINQGKGRFEEQALLRGVGYDADGRAEGSMGIDAADMDGDGDQDIAVPCLVDETFTLYVNDGRGTFTDASDPSGVSHATFDFTGYSPAFVDVDNDADLDLFFTTGRVYSDPGLAPGQEVDFVRRYGLQDLLLLNDGTGKFQNAGPLAGPHFDKRTIARGAAVGDYDNDGDMDIVVSNLNDSPVLLRNDAPGGNHWLGVILAGNPANLDGFGATVRCTAGGATQTRTVRDGGGYLSKNDPRAHFGLGAARSVDSLEVRWPSGAITTLQSVQADRYVVVKEAD